jgi:hypothetical protein
MFVRGILAEPPLRRKRETTSPSLVSAVPLLPGESNYMGVTIAG